MPAGGSTLNTVAINPCVPSRSAGAPCGGETHAARTAPPERPDAGLLDRTRPARPAEATERPHPGAAYAEVARACAGRWLRLLEATPWLPDASAVEGSSRTAAAPTDRHLAATLGLGLLTQIDPDQSGNAYLAFRVRAALVGWQLGLGGDGRPAWARLRPPGATAVEASALILLLADAPAYQTPELLGDMARHLPWLAKRPPAACWREAAAVQALADGGMLLRDGRLFGEARTRLSRLLQRQNPEGWFPERGGADLGRLSRTIDALARLYVEYCWDELAEPLNRAVGFLACFVDPDGNVGGCYNSRGSVFANPYGFELLARDCPAAAALARIARSRCLHFAARRLPGWDEELAAHLGASHALAAVHAVTDLPEELPPPSSEPETHFVRAGLSIFRRRSYFAVVNRRQGGAVTVTWPETGTRLEDAGVTVVAPHAILRPTWAPGTPDSRIAGTRITVRGALRATSPRVTRWSRLERWIGRATRGLRAVLTLGRGRAHPPGRQPGVGWWSAPSYHREFTFLDDTVEVRDDIRLPRPCQAVVCQTAGDWGTGSAPDLVPHRTPDFVPLIIDGARHVAIRRTYRGGRLVPRID